jgi:hypothetical protein
MSKLLKSFSFLTCLTGAAIWMSGCEQETVTPPAEEAEHVEHGEHGDHGHTHEEDAEAPAPEEAAAPAEETPAEEPVTETPPAEGAEGGSTINFGDL